jgi:hypothetical protein
MRAILPLLAALSLFLSACGFIPSQEEATETALAIQAAVTAEAAAAQAEEASAVATAEAAAAPPEEPEDEAESEDDATDEGETVTITTANGCEITFLGVREAFRSKSFEVRWRVVCDGKPGSGTFFATLGDPPSSPDATHASGELNSEGEVTLTLEVKWPPGETILYCSFGGEVYQVTEVTISDG